MLGKRSRHTHEVEQNEDKREKEKETKSEAQKVRKKKINEEGDRTKVNEKTRKCVRSISVSNAEGPHHREPELLLLLFHGRTERERVFICVVCASECCELCTDTRGSV